MGQKIRPDSLRLGIIENWRSRWWPKKNYREGLEEDFFIRRVINEKVSQAGVVKIEIERSTDNTFKIYLKVARPGLVIGRGGKGIEELTKAVESRLKALFRKRGVKNPRVPISLNVEELRRSEISSQYV